MASEFDGRLVVVTGGTGALGSAVVGRLVEGGARVRIPVFDPSELEHFAHKSSGSVETVDFVDLTDPARVDAFYTGIEGELWGSIHIAGGFAFGAMLENEPGVFEKMMRLNAGTCYLCCRSAAQRMRENGGGGRLVNVAARNALFPELGAQMVAYTASKAAVAAITQSLGAELAEHGIWVNAVAPSIIDTPANRSAMPDADHSVWPSPESLAETICFLASPRNTATRSAIVPVYGQS